MYSNIHVYLVVAVLNPVVWGETGTDTGRRFFSPLFVTNPVSLPSPQTVSTSMSCVQQEIYIDVLLGFSRNIKQIRSQWPTFDIRLISLSTKV